jgi:hypothetical protein
MRTAILALILHGASLATAVTGMLLFSCSSEPALPREQAMAVSWPIGEHADELERRLDSEGENPEFRAQLLILLSKEYAQSGDRQRALRRAQEALAVFANHGKTRGEAVRRALIVAIGRYGAEMEWHNLPDPRTGEKTEVPARTRARLGASYEMTAPLGRETLLLIASEQWIDFRPILTRAGVWNTGAAKGALGPFAPLFNLGELGEKGVLLIEPGQVATWAITGQVKEK